MMNKRESMMINRHNDGYRQRLILVAVFYLAFAIPCVIAASDLPPDPGEQGMQTLEGMDSNHNGVRDDVERYIGIHYADSAKTRSALMQYAEAMQEKLVNQKASLDPVHKVLRAYDCLVYVVGNSSATKMMTELEGIEMNTLPRMKAYVEDPPGTPTTDFYKLPKAPERKAECSFDPDALPN